MSEFPKLFELNTVIVNEEMSVFRFENKYQLLNEAGELVGYVCQKLSTGAKIARLFMSKAMLPFELEIQDTDQKVLAKIKRGFTFFMSKVDVFNNNEKLIGRFQGKFKLLGSRFDLEDEDGKKLGKIEGDFRGWDFKIFNNEGQQIGTVNKKWAGALKEIFTTADKYKVEIDEHVEENEDKMVILSVAIAVDMIMKENNN